MHNATKVVVDETVVNGETEPYVMYESDRREDQLPTGSDF